MHKNIKMDGRVKAFWFEVFIALVMAAFAYGIWPNPGATVLIFVSGAATAFAIALFEMRNDIFIRIERNKSCVCGITGEGRCPLCLKVARIREKT